MVKEEFAWECECGHIEYSNIIPSDCPKCLAIDSFTQLPEEIINEREKDALEEEMELSLTKQLKTKLKSSKLKAKLKKPKLRRKRK